MSTGGTWIIGEYPSWDGGISMWSEHFTQISKKTTENFGWLGQQIQSGIEPDTSCLLVLRAKPLDHCSGL